MADPFTAVAVTLTVGKSLMEYQAGKDAKDAYYSQAQHKELEGRREAVKAKEEGIEALKAMRKALANVSATSFAGGLEPDISGGTIENIGTQNILDPGFSDFFTAKSNESLAISMSLAQAEDLRFAGRQAKQQGVMSAMSTIAGGMASYRNIGGPTPDTSPTSSSYNSAPRARSSEYYHSNPKYYYRYDNTRRGVG